MIHSPSSAFKRWALAVACTLTLSGPGHAFELVPGHIYTSDSWTNSIIQVRPDGVEVDTLTLPGHTDGTKGLAFGPVQNASGVTNFATPTDRLRQRN